MAVNETPSSESTVQPRERLAVAIAIAALGGVIVWDGLRQTAASAYFPVAVGGAMIALSLITIAARDPESRATDEAPLRKGLPALVLLAGFIALAGAVGFLTASIAFIPAMALLGGDRNPMRIAIGTVAFIAAAYLVFHVILAQPLPAELVLGG